MKQLQEFSARTNFSLGMPARVDSPGFIKMSGWVRGKIEWLATNCRELLLTAAATAGISLLMLAASYIFLVQLAAYGW